MTLVIGTDEAGYGPNLGPLVVAATAWRVDAGTDPALLEAAFARAAEAAGPLWGDSKRIFRGGAGFAALERGAVAGLVLATGGVPATWQTLAAVISSDPAAAGNGEPGPPEAAARDAIALPCEALAADCLEIAGRVSAGLAAGGVSLATVRCRVIQPREFNRLLAAGLNKSDILSQATLDLAAPLAAAAPSEPVVVWCDRHGGRRRYAPLVTQALGAPLVQVIEETPERSVYHVPDRSCRFEFCVRGESRLPVALASMTAKYVREISMHAFNAFWGSRQPGLGPTAGYPVDAARWRDEAAAAVQAEGCDWNDLWRRA
ncbi:MAG: hypothetical protein K8S94_10490 [Planctomycetia bacterium]|nr:hypothetical protein [Planctomycetia bacterium]